MRIEMQRLSISLCLTNLKEICTGAVQDSLCNQLLYRPLALIVRVDLDEGFWPIAPISVLPFNFISDVWCGDPRKTS
jgi:hypothetical protein